MILVFGDPTTGKSHACDYLTLCGFRPLDTDNVVKNLAPRSWKTKPFDAIINDVSTYALTTQVILHLAYNSEIDIIFTNQAQLARDVSEASKLNGVDLSIYSFQRHYSDILSLWRSSTRRQENAEQRITTYLDHPGRLDLVSSWAKVSYLLHSSEYITTSALWNGVIFPELLSRRDDPRR